MNKLFFKLKDYTLEKAIELEEKDRQFIALKKLEKNIKNKDLYLALIISNSIICYQLSGKGENYWEEFSEYFIKNKINENKIDEKKINENFIIEELGKFIKNSKNNRRFVLIKQKRLEKLKPFLKNFFGNSEFFYKNMVNLRDDLAKIMKQKNNAKTIVFAVKMFGYGARNFYDFIPYPENIFIPIDSRLVALFEKYKNKNSDKNDDLDTNINDFYLDLSGKLKIPLLHLDGIVWNLYEDLIK